MLWHCFQSDCFAKEQMPATFMALRSLISLSEQFLLCYFYLVNKYLCKGLRWIKVASPEKKSRLERIRIHKKEVYFINLQYSKAGIIIKFEISKKNKN